MKRRRIADISIGHRAYEEVLRLFPKMKDAERVIGCEAYTIYKWKDGVSPSAIYLARLPELVQQLGGRLKEVQIENRPALDLIRRFNFDNVLIYADPPYLLDTRGGKQYRHEMTEQDHIDLLAALLQHKGPVILSGYPSELYDRELNGWSRIIRKVYNQNADQRTEVLWCNFETGQTSLFDGGDKCG